MPAQASRRDNRLQTGRKSVCPSSQIQIETSTAGQCHTWTFPRNIHYPHMTLLPKVAGILPGLGELRTFSMFSSSFSQSSFVPPTTQSCTGTWQLTPRSQLDLTRGTIPLMLPLGSMTEQKQSQAREDSLPKTKRSSVCIPGSPGWVFSSISVQIQIILLQSITGQCSHLSWLNPSQQQIPTKPITHSSHWSGEGLKKIK